MSVSKKKNIKIPTEILNIIDDVIDKNKDPVKSDNSVLESNTNDIEWDVPIDQEITFFDASLSYELTGYRPINRDKGLDFDPKWFTEDRANWLKTGHYTDSLYGSKSFADFWDKQFERCRNGMESHGYKITGDHYFFLNFYQLPNLNTSKAGMGRSIDFPDFYVAQYEWFHYLEMCKQLRKNAALMKARGLGFSEMNASLAANMYTVRDNSKTVIAAWLSKYVEGTLSKVWQALSFLNDSTDDGFSQLSQVVNNSLKRKASYIEYRNGLKVESGSLAMIEGIVADTPNKIRGDRVDLLLYEEGGSFMNSTKAFIQGDALIHILGKLFGYKVIGGRKPR